MRILVALGEGALLRCEDPASVLARVAADNELIVVYPHEGMVGQMLELALRNALPDRDVVSVLTQVVVDAHDSSTPPQAIAETRSLRILLDAGALVLCAEGGTTPVTLDREGAMRSIEAEIDHDLTAALLARRLDADLLLMLGAAEDSSESRVEAAFRFAEATNRRAAVGSLAEAARIVRGEAGVQVGAPPV